MNRKYAALVLVVSWGSIPFCVGQTVRPNRVMQPAIPPVSLEKLSSVLDQDLSASMKYGELAPWAPTGVTVGILSHGQRLILTYGKAKPDSIYELGSISKTFTGLILAQMAEQCSVRLNEPVRDLLPPGLVSKPPSKHEITLIDLSDHHAGLPRDLDEVPNQGPPRLTPAQELYAFIGKHGVALPPETPFSYSNMGADLLGVALANRAKMPFQELLTEEVVGPLGLHDTTTMLTESMRARLLQGHNGAQFPVPATPDDVLPGAGGIRSTASDMLTYLDSEMHPEKLASDPSAVNSPRTTISAAIRETQIVRASARPHPDIAIGWFHLDTGEYWHGGVTDGYSSDARFDSKADYAVIVLCNVYEDDSMFTQSLGEHIAERLTGRPAIALQAQQP